jgi:amino acid adenylation domain-containing protein
VTEPLPPDRPAGTLWELLAASAHHDGDSTAVEYGDQKTSYRELHRRALACAGALRHLGVEAGDRVAILDRNSIDALGWLFGIARLGAVAIVVSDKLKSSQIDQVVRHSGTRLLVANRRLRGLLHGGDLDGLRVIDVADAVSADASAPLPERPIGRQLALLIYTSGSTGLPKGVMVTHDNLAAGARIVARYLRLSGTDRVLAVLPWSFDAGLNQVLSTFYAGGTVVIARSSFPPDVCRTLSTHRITGLAGVPPLWEMLVGPQSPFTRLDLPDLRYVTTTGGVLPARTLRSIREAHSKTAVYLMYGLTEAFRSTYLPPTMVDAHPASMGRAIPETEILVLDAGGRPCVPDEVGELVHRGPTVAAGYWRDPDATREVFRPYPFGPIGAVPEYVVYSGDYVRRDKDGLLYYVGRRDEQFKARGHRVTPTQIEASLLSSGTVRETVVFPDDTGAAEPDITAVVVPTDARTFTAQALLDHCRATAPNYLWPVRIIVVDDIPRTPSGKLDRNAVKEAYAS